MWIDEFDLWREVHRLRIARHRLIATLDAILQKRFDAETFFFTTRRGQGMSMCLARTLLREIMRNPGQKVYVNFDLPKPAQEMIGKYATIERIDANTH